MNHDIRNFFTAAAPKSTLNGSDNPKRKTSGKSSISNEANRGLTPPPTKRPKKVEFKRVIVSPETTEDDLEEPLAPKFRKKSKNKQIGLSEVIEIPTSPIPRGPPLNLRAPIAKLEQWVDKHRPMDLKTLIGQHTDQAPAKKLERWLKEWPRNNLGGIGALKKPKATVGSSANDGSAFRAALLSGPPGVGKTTTARLVCEELGLRYIEMNASDARSKKLMEQKIGGMLHTQKIPDFFGRQTEKPKVEAKGGHKVTSVLIMDEVDGMSGNQDRAGIAELILMIKKSEIPIVCICNDRQSQKVRSLANYCFDLRVNRPTVQQILGRMMTILAREKIKMPKEEVEKVIQASNQDLRQAIYSLQLLAAGQNQMGDIMLKDCSMNIFEAARRLLIPETKMMQKRDLFFMDYSLMPLFVQEMYLSIRSANWGKRPQLYAQSLAAESIAIGDMISRQIRSAQNWSLLPLQGMMSCVLPPSYLNGHPIAQVNFPQWLGKFSNERKRRRLLSEFEMHAGIKMSGPQHAIAADYIPLLRQRIIRPLIGKDPDIEEVLDIYHEYEMVRDDFETINELGMWSEKDDLWKRVETKTKSALTRALNKDNFKLPYAVESGVQIMTRTAGGKRAAAKLAKQKLQEIAQENEEEDEVVDEDPEAMAEILNA